MKNTLLFAGVIVGLLMPMTILASSNGGRIGDPINVPIQVQADEEPNGRPRTQSLFTASLDTDLNILSVSALYNVGEVNVVIENLTTGEYAEYSFDSALPEDYPISGNAGFWRITLMLENGALYYGEFVL